MLPFLKPKKIASLVISKRKPDGAGIEAEASADDADAGAVACAEGILRAIESKDARALASALRDAMTCMDTPEADEAEQEQMS